MIYPWKRWHPILKNISARLSELLFKRNYLDEETISSHHLLCCNNLLFRSGLLVVCSIFIEREFSELRGTPESKCNYRQCKATSGNDCSYRAQPVCHNTTFKITQLIG